MWASILVLNSELPASKFTQICLENVTSNFSDRS